MSVLDSLALVFDDPTQSESRFEPWRESTLNSITMRRAARES